MPVRRTLETLCVCMFIVSPLAVRHAQNLLQCDLDASHSDADASFVSPTNLGSNQRDTLFWRASQPESKGGRIVYIFGVQHNALHRYAVHFAQQIKSQLQRDGISIKSYYVENDLGWLLWDNDLIHEVSDGAVGKKPLALESKEEWMTNHAYEAKKKGVTKEYLYENSCGPTNMTWDDSYKSTQQLLADQGPQSQYAKELKLFASGDLNSLNARFMPISQYKEIFLEAGLQVRNDLYATRAMAEDAAFITMGLAHLTLGDGKDIVGVVTLMQKEGWELKSLPLQPVED